MAITGISELIEPITYDAYGQRDSLTQFALFQAGVVRTNPVVDAAAKTGGRLAHFPVWNDLDNSEPNGSTDTSTAATPKATGAVDNIARVGHYNQGWSSADLAAQVAGSDPQASVRARTDTYWARAYQRYVIASLQGIAADNKANDSSDMVTTVGNDTTAAVAAAERISADNVLTCKQQLGDAADLLTTIVMHSVVHTRLQRLNLIAYVESSEGNVRFPTYLGYRVVVDDGMPAVSGTNKIMYTTMLCADGVVLWGQGQPKVPVEVERLPSQGTGGGVENLWVRRSWIAHVNGFQFTGSPAAESPTITELQTATTWDRVVARKEVPICFLESNE